MTGIALTRRHEAFLLFDWLRVDELFTRERYGDHDLDSVTAILDLAHRLAEEVFLPHYKQADADEPRLRDGPSLSIGPYATRSTRSARPGSPLVRSIVNSAECNCRRPSMPP